MDFTSTGLIAQIKRRALIPTSQNLFTSSDIISQMDDMELEKLMPKSGEDIKPEKKGITIVKVESNKVPMKDHMMEDASEENEPPENTIKDQAEDVSEGEPPKTEEEIDTKSVLGRLRKKLKGVM